MAIRNVLKNSEVTCSWWLKKKPSLMSLSEYCVVCFPILEYGHFYLVCFDLENTTITVIDNMAVEESPIHLINDNEFFNKTTPYKVVSNI
ncbi:hypothetical protein Hanom_Chr14g01329581 [Helianthus anomalus]